eukprot:gb/GECG01001008.1/.p1 GENE.gb/GECG01001008.1/~~gb/GECG01001008.1/.p1  ORF type:complete len:224 (+),score=35.24 gb/GECG01001008.1/:1-672(+)
MGNEHSSPASSSHSAGEDADEVAMEFPLKLTIKDKRELKQACEDTGDAKVISHLLSQYPHLNINHIGLDEEGRTPLYAACQNGFKKVAQVLLDKYPDDVDRKNPKYHKTPLSGCILKRTTKNPLYSNKHPNFAPPEEIIEMLVNEYNADVNSMDQSQHTPLHWAAYLGYMEAAQIILDSGRANLTLKNFAGQTPYDLAVHTGHDEVAQLLKQHMSREAIQTFA